MKRKKLRKVLVKFVVAFFLVSLAQGFFLTSPVKLESATLTSASATLSNSRLSYRAGILGTPGAGTAAVNIDTSGNADNDTNHLFPGDTVCFSDSGENGCSDETDYTVSNIVDTDTFNFTPGLVGALEATDLVIATQSGSLTIAFTTVSEIPTAGDILITLPAINTDNKTCDGIPDTAASASVNGFDLKSVAAGDITTTGCTDANWVATETIACGSSSADHTIRIDRQTAACAASSAITFTIDSDPGVINPAPISSGHTQGLADAYTINIKTRDGSDNTLDEIDIKAAPVEAVLVSATVDETISFQVAGLGIGSTACGQTTDVTTTAYSVPWGTLATADTFVDAAQQLTVSTNADGGYSVKVEENDQMGKNGVACSGAGAGESVNCIQDTTCSASGCDETTGYDWTAAATYQGLGYSLENYDGTDASFVYDSNDPCSSTAAAGTFCAKTFADQEVPETKATIMTNASPVSSKDVYVCYRIAISATQPSGYYYNKVKYTATAIF